MAKDDEITFHITIECEEDDEPFTPSVFVVAAHNFVSTIHGYVMLFILLIPIGWIISLF